ncbi:MAG: fibro-slime domain-containing protein [Deltaproteobacteria bacterium]|nr:fibro-slime domain-containing protein [Deltaproteobacteria bacterium]
MNSLTRKLLLACMFVFLGCDTHVTVNNTTPPVDSGSQQPVDSGAESDTGLLAIDTASSSDTSLVEDTGTDTTVDTEPLSDSSGDTTADTVLVQDSATQFDSETSIGTAADSDTAADTNDTGSASESDSASESGDDSDSGMDTETVPAAVCGNSTIEKGEGCDDGNQMPFDGCSVDCQKEPDCSSGACVSVCGDGLVLNEECDDGNVQNGDGCSATCKIENGYQCDNGESCAGADCTVTIDALYRDFLSTDTDFDVNCESADPILHLVENQIGTNGKPSLADDGDTDACIASRVSFAKWFSGSPAKAGTMTLFADGQGGFVNRYGDSGEQWIYTNDKRISFCAFGPEVVDCTYVEDADCWQACPQVVQQYPDYICTSPCPHDYSNRTCLTSPERGTCDDCPNFAAGVAGYECRNPCSQSSPSSGWGNWDVCEFGAASEYYDGNPLFFPLDGLDSDSRAVIPPEYGSQWQQESEITGQTVLHNFFFTTEMISWMTYDAGKTAVLKFTGDDDVFVFINGRLAIDLGGVHAPVVGEVTIDALNNFGMQDKKVYPIQLFHAERRLAFSTFKLEMTGFSVLRLAPSSCSPVQ